LDPRPIRHRTGPARISFLAEVKEELPKPLRDSMQNTLVLVVLLGIGMARPSPSPCTAAAHLSVREHLGIDLPDHPAVAIARDASDHRR
jgi:hypothetical protein